MVDDGESFWDVVREPFLRRKLGPDVVRVLIARAYDDSGGSYRRVGRRFGIESDRKKLLNFLRNHNLGVKR